MTEAVNIFWFRNDLRLTDNPGLIEAALTHKVLPIYILEDAGTAMGSASKLWLHHSLATLNNALGGTLNIYKGDSLSIIQKIIAHTPVQGVYWNRVYDPQRIHIDSIIKDTLKKNGITCHSANGSLLFEPAHITRDNNTHYKVFTPYFRACFAQHPPRAPLPPITDLSVAEPRADRIPLEALDLQSHHPWETKILSHWKIGEKAAHAMLEHFIDQKLLGYKEKRNNPGDQHTSQLSPYLHHGEISPHTIWHAVLPYLTHPAYEKDAYHFLSELGWRDFSYYLLYYFKDLPTHNFQPQFDLFPWKKNDVLLKAWQEGRTGYPLVDAGMRELSHTGFMHNRVRMVVASFLVKNLQIHWHDGSAWFWDCLVDADIASNSASWQWVAGSGADAAPYFRIFNPMLQGEKHDKNGLYTRHYVPELAQLPDKYLYTPWNAPAAVLADAGVRLGDNYPYPIVDCDASRKEALEAYHMLRKTP